MDLLTIKFGNSQLDHGSKDLPIRIISQRGLTSGIIGFPVRI